MTRDEVQTLIDRAFEDVDMPRTEAELSEDGLEGPYVIAHFFGRSRDELDETTFAPWLHMEDFTYMEDNAVAYYLPPVLKWMLKEPHDDDLWGALDAFLSSPRRRTTTSLRGLRRAQLEAIAAWADFLTVSFVGAFGCDPKKAASLARLYRELAAAAPE